MPPNSPPAPDAEEFSILIVIQQGVKMKLEDQNSQINNKLLKQKAGVVAYRCMTNTEAEVLLVMPPNKSLQANWQVRFLTNRLKPAKSHSGRVTSLPLPIA